MTQTAALNTQSLDIQSNEDNELPTEIILKIVKQSERTDIWKLSYSLYAQMIKDIFNDDSKTHLQEKLIGCWLSEPNDLLIQKKAIILDKIQLKMQKEHIPFLKRAQWLYLYNHLRGKKAIVPDMLILALKKHLISYFHNFPSSHYLDIFSHIVPMLSQAQVDLFFDYLTQKSLLISFPVHSEAGHALLALSKRLSSIQLTKLANLLDETFSPYIKKLYLGNYYLASLLNQFAKHLASEQFIHFQPIVLQLARHQAWNLLPSIKNLLPLLDKKNLDAYADDIIYSFSTDETPVHELISIAEAALINPALIPPKSLTWQNPPKLLALIISVFRDIKNNTLLSNKKKLSLIIGMSVFLHLLPSAGIKDLSKVHETTLSLLSTDLNAEHKLMLAQVLCKIDVISPTEKTEMMLSSEGITLEKVIICSALNQAQLIEKNTLEDYLWNYLSKIKEKPDLLWELLDCALFSPHLAQALKKFIDQFYTFESILATLNDAGLPIKKVRASIIILFTPIQLENLFIQLFNSIPNEEDEQFKLVTLEKLAHCLNPDILAKVIDKLLEDIQSSLNKDSEKLINLLGLIRSLAPTDLFADIRFLNFLTSRIDTTQINLKISILETLSHCFDYVSLPKQQNILHTLINHLSSSTSFFTNIISNLFFKLPAAEKNSSLELVQIKLAKLKKKYHDLPETATTTDRLRRSAINWRILDLQAILAENNILDRGINWSFIKSIPPNDLNIKKIYQYTYKICILMKKTECQAVLKYLFNDQLAPYTLEKLKLFCLLIEQGKMESDEFNEQGNIYQEFMFFYSIQYDLSINQEKILTRLSARKVKLSEKQQLLWSSFDRLWDKNNSFLDNAALLVNDYGFHESKLLRFFSNRHYLPATEKLMTQLRKKKITSIEDLYHQLITIECTNSDGHLYTLREYLFQKMKETLIHRPENEHIARQSNHPSC